MAAGAAAAVAAGIALLVAHPRGPLRLDPGLESSWVDAIGPLLHSIEPVVALLFFVPGVVYGLARGSVRSDRDVARMASESMSAMSAYIVLAFVAAQFVAYFDWTQLGTIGAVRGARLLTQAGLGGAALVLSFVVVSAAMNLLVGSASAKWAFMAPIFVPMLMLQGVSPEATQAAYRVGDSITNVIAPLLPYLPLVIVVVRQHVPTAGIGTVLALMLPYSIAFGLVWSLLLSAWIGLGVPLGPGAAVDYAPGGASVSGVR